MLRIARNHCLDVLRRRLPAAARRSSSTPSPRTAAPRARRSRRRSAATTRWSAASSRRSSTRAVAALPQNYREVIQLFHVEHLSYKEIAATLDVPIGTVMTWLHRARAKLKAALAEAGAEVSP